MDVVEDDWRVAELNTGMPHVKNYLALEMGPLVASAQRDYEAGRYRFIGF